VCVTFLSYTPSSNNGTCQAVSILKSIHPGDYHVTIISPDTFTTFTPLLPCESAVSKPYTAPDIPGAFSAAAVGTVSVRSLIESLRKIIARLHGQFIHGRAIDLVMSERLLEVETVSVDGETRNIYVPCVRYYHLKGPKN